eukprot:GHVP01039104.1.p1 GENE.GHVP01039104.1~~GHVP01039104.1.p1  ORF type:complete len:167 (+),score=19.09 GHVP01039104.1:40-540(+)
MTFEDMKKLESFSPAMSSIRTITNQTPKFSMVTEKDIEAKFPRPTEEGSAWKKFFSRLPKKCWSHIRTTKILKILSQSVPIFHTLRTYKLSYIQGDVSAGLSAGIMAVPMGISYALLANVPPEYGHYNNMLFPAMYIFFGTCAQASVGVSAIEALLVSETVASMTA